MAMTRWMPWMRWMRWAGAIALACAWLPAPAAQPVQLRFVAQPWPPFIHKENGKLTGPFADIVWAACEAIQAQCTIELFPWRRALQMVTEGEADGLLAILDLPERRLQFHMSPALIHTAYVLYARQDSTLHDPSPAMLDGYTVACFGPSGTSSVAARLAQAAPNARLAVEIDNQTALRKLRMGRYGGKAVVLINEDLGIWLMRQEGDAGLRQVGEVQKITYHLGMSRKRMAPAVKDRFMATLEEMIRSGAVKDIAARHGMRGVQQVTPTP
jgi:polar amino acid transport system substrate-binding protein